MIKSSKYALQPHFWQYSVMRSFFILSGAKFYMDWLLVTNPISKNPIIKLLWGWTKKWYTGTKYEQRLHTAISCFTVHFVLGIIYYFIDCGFVTNMAVNVYPCIVNAWIGYRCWRIKKLRITPCGLPKCRTQKLRSIVNRPAAFWQTACYMPLRLVK